MRLLGEDFFLKKRIIEKNLTSLPSIDHIFATMEQPNDLSIILKMN